MIKTSLSQKEFLSKIEELSELIEVRPLNTESLQKRVEYIKRKVEGFIVLLLIFSASLPWIVYLTRILNAIIGLMPGEGLGLVVMFWSSFMLLLPVCLPHGALFTFGCKIYSQRGSNIAPRYTGQRPFP